MSYFNLHGVGWLDGGQRSLGVLCHHVIAVSIVSRCPEAIEITTVLLLVYVLIKVCLQSTVIDYIIS